MATQRYVSTSFWDDRWIRSLNPADRYLYLYLMTNPLTTIAGIYRITIDRIAFDTGYDERTLRPMLQKFADSGKAHHYDDEWMILPSWPSHQRISERDKIRTGIDAMILSLPDDVYEILHTVGYRYKYLQDIVKKRPLMDHTRVIKDHVWSSNYSDSDSDSDSDLDIKNTKASALVASTAIEPKPATKTATPEPAAQTRELSAMSDQVADLWQSMITAEQPHETWSNYAKERAALSALSKRTKALHAKTPMDSDIDLAKALFTMFLRIKGTSRSDYWARAPVTPSAVLQRWSDITAELARLYSQEAQAREFDAAEIAL
jgi:hypothetical protein